MIPQAEQYQMPRQYPTWQDQAPRQQSHPSRSRIIRLLRQDVTRRRKTPSHSMYVPIRIQM